MCFGNFLRNHSKRSDSLSIYEGSKGRETSNCLVRFPRRLIAIGGCPLCEEHHRRAELFVVPKADGCDGINLIIRVSGCLGDVRRLMAVTEKVVIAGDPGDKAGDVENWVDAAEIGRWA
ncbi:hypothetical protein Vretifemale_15017 [Volvox reticuliferus]|uniref:Uncharacterized protein n=1 Tax=Volvox reticuliferus TaxID=1737510 RepID=A0A8J4FW89_9CHLO|nr:hypothetical protein Vretifemale_15017 [Volvox reticuliferus]